MVYIVDIVYTVDTVYRVYPGPRAESAKAVTGRQCPHSGEGGRLFDGSTNFFYENCSNSGTESQKIDPKVGN